MIKTKVNYIRYFSWKVTFWDLRRNVRLRNQTAKKRIGAVRTIGKLADKIYN